MKNSTRRLSPVWILTLAVFAVPMSGLLAQDDKEKTEDEKPKRSSIPKGWDVADIDFDKAMMLLQLPRDVGPHPEDG